MMLLEIRNNRNFRTSNIDISSVTIKLSPSINLTT